MAPSRKVTVVRDSLVGASVHLGLAPREVACTRSAWSIARHVPPELLVRADDLRSGSQANASERTSIIDKQGTGGRAMSKAE